MKYSCILKEKKNKPPFGMNDGAVVNEEWFRLNFYNL